MSVLELQTARPRQETYLLDCPFCGHPARLSVGSNVTIECVSANCSVHPRVSGDNERDVAMAWNRRPR
jgi:hypothetical protein